MAATLGSTVLMQGATGDDVRAVQDAAVKYLEAHHMQVRHVGDYKAAVEKQHTATFGWRTERVLRAIQHAERHQGNRVARDGRFGPQMARVLGQYMQTPEAAPAPPQPGAPARAGVPVRRRQAVVTPPPAAQPAPAAAAPLPPAAALPTPPPPPAAVEPTPTPAAVAPTPPPAAVAPVPPPAAVAPAPPPATIAPVPPPAAVAPVPPPAAVAPTPPPEIDPRLFSPDRLRDLRPDDIPFDNSDLFGPPKLVQTVPLTAVPNAAAPPPPPAPPPSPATVPLAPAAPEPRSAAITAAPAPPPPPAPAAVAPAPPAAPRPLQQTAAPAIDFSPARGGPDLTRPLSSYRSGGPIESELPAKGPGYITYSPTGIPARFGTPRTIEMIKRIAKTYYEQTGLTLRIGDISRRDGAALGDHKAHRNGNNVDFDLAFNDGRTNAWPKREDPINATRRSPAYDLAATKYLAQLIRYYSPGAQILNNDTRIAGVTPYPNHDNHMHAQRLHAGEPRGPVPQFGVSQAPGPVPAPRAPRSSRPHRGRHG